MVVLDAYAVIAFLRDEVAADDVAELLRKPTAMSVVNAAEVTDHLIRVAGLSEDETAIRMRMLTAAGMSLVDAHDVIATRAGEIRSRHYNRTTCAISLADCFAVATSAHIGAALATADAPLAAVSRAEHVEVIALPDSRGARP